MTKRYIEISGTEVRLELSKVTALNLKDDVRFINLDMLKDGTWRLIYTKNTIPDITKVSALTIIREN